METVVVERQPWEPAEKNMRVPVVEDLAGVRIFDGELRLEEPDGQLVAIICEANRKDHARLAWMGREILAKVSWHDGNLAPSSSNRLSGLKYPNITFGTTAPAPLRRRYACSVSGLDRELPRLGVELRNLAATAWAALQAYSPEIAEEVLGRVMPKVHDDWLLFEAPWTSGIINKSAALPYHRDAGNLPGSWSAQYVVRNRGTGGFLHLPEYNVALTCPDKSLALFNGQAVWHGVTPMAIEDHPEAYRYSMVYYAKSACQVCGSATEEAGRAQRVATEHDVYRASMLDGIEEDCHTP